MLLEQSVEPAAILTHLGAIFVSLELSQSKWVITSVSPGNGEKMSRHVVEAGDVPALLARFAKLREKALARTGRSYPIIVIQEAGLDGFWIHRVLVREGIESYVVDAASIPVPRRRRRAKTDRIDGETLLRLADGVQARRSPGVLDGASADARGRRPAPRLPRAQAADRGAGRTRQPDQGVAALARD